MKKIIAITAAAILTVMSLSAQQTTDLPFPTPTAPADIQKFNDRVDYVIDHYWDRCDFKRVFSNRAGMAKAFASYLDLLPHASKDMAHKSIDKLLKELKKNPEGLQFIVDRAEVELYSDSAEYTSDEVFVTFLNAARENKKIDKVKRERYDKPATSISASMLDERIPSLSLIRPDGTATSLEAIVDADTTAVTAIYIFDPADVNGRVERLRLDADSRLNNMIRNGQIRFVALYPGAPDDRWKEAAKDLSKSWVVVAAPDAHLKLDMRRFPQVYLIDKHGVIRTKNITAAEFLNRLYSF